MTPFFFWHQLSRKRRRIILPSDSEGSDDEFQPTKHEESDSDSASSGVDENMVSEPEPESAEESPVKVGFKNKIFVKTFKQTNCMVQSNLVI